MTPITSPSPSALRSAALTQPLSAIWYSSKKSVSAGRRVGRKRLEGDDRKGVLDARQVLHPLGDEMPDIGRIGQVEFHQEVVLARGRINFRNFFDALHRFVGDRVGFA